MFHDGLLLAPASMLVESFRQQRDCARRLIGESEILRAGFEIFRWLLLGPTIHRQSSFVRDDQLPR
jgi:hypothetical protein